MNLFQRSGSGVDLEPLVYDDMGLSHVEFRHAPNRPAQPKRKAPEWASQQGRNGTSYAPPPAAREVLARLCIGAAIVAVLMLTAHFGV